MNEKYIQFLRNAIQSQHGCISRYVQTVAVKSEGNMPANVEVFDLAGHATARQCYAWGVKDDAGHWQYVAILKLPPADSAQKAVDLHKANTKAEQSAKAAR